MSQKPLPAYSQRRTGIKLFVQGLQKIFQARSALYGFYEKRIIGPASTRKRDAMGKREQRDFIKQYEIQQT